MSSNIKDVAKRANVSIATVSRCLKNNYPVSQETRERVMSAVSELDYVPNFMASGLKNNRVKLIGVLLPNLRNNVVLSIAEAISVALDAKGYRLLYACSENNPSVENDFLSLFRSSLVEGIIVATTMENDECFRVLKSSSIPVVLLDRFVGSGNLDWVGEDCYKASYELTNYLISCGHKRIAYIKGIKGVSISNERYAGYLKALNDAGLQAHDELQIEGDFLEDMAFDNVYALLKDYEASKLPSAIYAASSTMAKGALNAVLMRGMRVPDDISIASYGNLEETNTWRNITCIKQDALKIGTTIGDLIVRRIEEKQGAKQVGSVANIKVKTTLVKGETVKKI